jgi:hypothetical protein
MICPLSEVKHLYLPHVAIRADSQTHGYNGFLYTMAERVEEAFDHLAMQQNIAQPANAGDDPAP